MCPEHHYFKMLCSVIVAVVAFIALNSQGISATESPQTITGEITHTIQRLEDQVQKLSANQCACVEYNCGCCQHIVEKQIRLDSTICANATYLKQDYGFSLTVTFNKYTVFNETMSLRNPPPVCMGAPFVKELAEVCVRIYDIQATKAHLHACVEVEAKLKHIHIAKYEIGCFDMLGKNLQQALQQMENEIS